MRISRKRVVMDTEDLKVGDPEAKCYMPGVPRATYMPYPFQIIQGTEKILIAYEFAHADREIHLDEGGCGPVSRRRHVDGSFRGALGG